MSGGYNAFFVICASQVVFVILEACLLLSSVKYHRNELVNVNHASKNRPQEGEGGGEQAFQNSSFDHAR